MRKEQEMRGYLRSVSKQDMDFLFKLANDKKVRQNSFSPKEIMYDEHRKWFDAVFNREDYKQYIYMLDEKSIGQVHLEMCGSKAEIGYSICEEYRGQGLGKELISLIQLQVKKDFPHIKTLTAKVKPENTISQKVFEAEGFQEKYYVYEWNCY